MPVPTWRDALIRYRTRRDLATRARRAPFSMQSVGSVLIITPGSGHPRRITEHQWERSLPFIDSAGRGPLIEASFNSSYIEAIVHDLRHR